MATLTKARLLEIAAPRVKLVKDVPTFGDVWVRDIGEVQRSRRISSLFDSDGNRIQGATELRRLHSIIDQVCEDESGTPMFTDADIKDLKELGSARLDPLMLAIMAFNGDEEKNDEAGSVDSSGSLAVMVG